MGWHVPTLKTHMGKKFKTTYNKMLSAVKARFSIIPVVYHYVFLMAQLVTMLKNTSIVCYYASMLLC